MSEEATKVYLQGVEYANKAIAFEKDLQYSSAIRNYKLAADSLIKAGELGMNSKDVVDKAEEYLSQSRQLMHTLYKIEKNSLFKKIECVHKFDNTSDDMSEKISKYKSLIEEILIFQKQDFFKVQKQADKDSLDTLAYRLIARAEELKKTLELRSTASFISIPINSAPSTSKGPRLSKEEINVLRSTSRINEQEFLPFLDDIDSKEVWFYDKGFSDSFLPLSDKQQGKFARWVRPKDFMSDPKMIVQVSSETIKQTCVTDCSFIASIAIAADYERITRRSLITKIIYPQNSKGPQYNPSGKYMIKLHLNGVPRKVIIDDFLPMGRDNELLCSYSSNPSELWISFLEKAYMKVMGGYDFPGSSSNIDLHALTGWIPERVAIRPGTLQFNKTAEFRRIMEAFKNRWCLVTIATGQISQTDADRAGLVPTHAYAMLDIRQVGDFKLFKLKNPWSHLRWKGNFSATDSRNWTKQMEKNLEYDSEAAQKFDNGIFWIDYDSICHFFDVICINWDPKIFKYSYTLHNEWKAVDGPMKDIYTSYHNPQYKLELDLKSETRIWVLLTRHITEKADFANNKEFIGLAVYKNVPSRKVYYPYDPPPWVDSQRINSPHCLVKMVDEGTSSREYILLVSQYEKRNNIRYTLTVYSDARIIRMQHIKDPWLEPIKLTGEWNDRTAGGSVNDNTSYSRNPTYQINIKNDGIENELLVELLAPKNFAVALEITSVIINNENAPNKFKRKFSGDYRHGYVMLELSGLSGGIYNVIPSTYDKDQKANFFLNFYCNKPSTVSELRNTK